MEWGAGRGAVLGLGEARTGSAGGLKGQDRNSGKGAKRSVGLHRSQNGWSGGGASALRQLISILERYPPKPTSFCPLSFSCIL